MKSQLTIKFNFRAMLFAILILLQPISLIIEMNYGALTFISYTDEILCIICLIYAAYLPFKVGLKKVDFAVIVFLALLSILGLLGNIKYKIATNNFAVFVDLLCLLKVFMPFIVFKFVGEVDKDMLVAKYLVPFSKLLIIVGTFFGFISLFYDIGMSDGFRYGIPSYFFIFKNGARYGYIISCALLILMITNTPKQKLLFYEVMTVFNLIIITKGVVYIVLAVYLILKFFWRNKKNPKLNLGNIVTIAIGSVLVSTLQIRTYIMDSNSPRMTLIKYGFITANKYLPLGSGFATYGSDMAMKNYSPLYKLYGFNNMYGMSIDNTAFLNDCYLGMVIGQFGYVGLLLYLVIIAIVFSVLYKCDKFGGTTKALVLAVFVGLVISSIGTAIIKSSIGVMVMAVLGLVCGYVFQSERNRQTNVKILI